MKMRTALGLIRVSTDGQDVARQRADLKKLARQYGIDIVRVLELVGVSGTATLNNEQVQQVLREVQQPGIDGLACSAVDRLARPKRGADYAIATAFEDAKKTIWTVRDGYMEMWTDEGWERFMTALTRAGSEWREIRRRSLDGKLQKKLEGRHVNGNQTLPYGLRFDKRTGWSYDEAALAKIAEGYRLVFEDRHSKNEICRRVGWGRGGWRTLMNPSWRGVRAYPATADQDAFEVPLPLKPLLTRDQWERAQALLAKNKTWSKATRIQRFLGAGVLTCQCGKKYYIHSDTRRGPHDEYMCSTRHRGGPGCGARRLKRMGVDAAIETLVAGYLSDPRFLAAVFARVKQEPKPDLEARERELARLAARRARLLDALEDGTITKAEFAARAAKLQDATREVEARMPTAAPPAVDVRAVVAGLVRWALRFPKIADFEEKRTELKRVVRSTTVVDEALAEFAVSGAAMGEFTNSAQPLTRPCWPRSPSSRRR